MPSIDGNNDSSGANQNSMQPTNQVHHQIGQMAQLSQLWGYRFPNINYLGPQWHNPFMPFSVYPPPNMNWMPFGAPAPHYQTYQPPYFQQFQAPATMQAQLPQMSVHPAVLNSYSFNNNPVHAANPPMLCETQPSGQGEVASAPLPENNHLIPANSQSLIDSCEAQPSDQLLSDVLREINEENTACVSPLLPSSTPTADLHPCEVPGYSASTASSICETLQCFEQDFVLPAVSTPGDAARASGPSSPDETQPCAEDFPATSLNNQVSKSDSVPEDNARSIVDNPTRVTSTAPSVSDAQLEAQGLPSRQRRTRAKDRSRLGSKSRKRNSRRNWSSCECPYCSAEGGNKVRHKNGTLMHACHIPDCGRLFDRPSYLRKHLVDHRKTSVQKNFFCDHCSMGFASRVEIRRHVEKHGNPIPHRCQCPNCRVGCGNKIRDSNGKPLHVCHILNCGRAFSDFGTLRKHLGWHSRRHKFFCAHCYKGCANKGALVCHVRKVHANVERDEPQSDRFDYRVPPTSPQDIENILKNVKSQPSCHVAGCGRVFASTSNLNEHLRSLHDFKTLICQFCDEKFKRLKDLRRHKLTHAVEKTSFACSDSSDIEIIIDHIFW